MHQIHFLRRWRLPVQDAVAGAVPVCLVVVCRVVESLIGSLVLGRLSVPCLCAIALGIVPGWHFPPEGLICPQIQRDAVQGAVGVGPVVLGGHKSPAGPVGRQGQAAGLIGSVAPSVAVHWLAQLMALPSCIAGPDAGLGAQVAHGNRQRWLAIDKTAPGFGQIEVQRRRVGGRAVLAAEV